MHGVFRTVCVYADDPVVNNMVINTMRDKNGLRCNQNILSFQKSCGKRSLQFVSKKKPAIDSAYTLFYKKTGDLLDKSSKRFTELKPFTPRTLKSTAVSRLKNLDCYNAPKKQKFRESRNYNAKFSNDLIDINEETNINEISHKDDALNFNKQCVSVSEYKTNINIFSQSKQSNQLCQTDRNSKKLDNLAKSDSVLYTKNIGNLYGDRLCSSYFDDNNKSLSSVISSENSIVDYFKMESNPAYLHFLSEVATDILKRGAYMNDQLRIIFFEHLNSPFPDLTIEDRRNALNQFMRQLKYKDDCFESDHSFQDYNTHSNNELIGKAPIEEFKYIAATDLDHSSKALYRSNILQKFNKQDLLINSNVPDILEHVNSISHPSISLRRKDIESHLSNLLINMELHNRKGSQQYFNDGQAMQQEQISETIKTNSEINDKIITSADFNAGNINLNEITASNLLVSEATALYNGSSSFTDVTDDHASQDHTQNNYSEAQTSEEIVSPNYNKSTYLPLSMAEPNELENSYVEDFDD